MATAFERKNGKIKTYKTTRRGQRVEMIEVLTTLAMSKIEARKELQEAVLTSIVITLTVGLIGLGFILVF